jgi:hypothetical protein
MYKQTIIILAFCSFLSNAGMAQDEERNKIGFYPTISFLTAFPAGTFKNDFDRKVLLGFNVDGVIIPVKKIPFWQPGAQVEFLFTGNKKDTWKGIEVETGGAFIKLNIINRIRPSHTGKIDPFFEFAYGLNISATTTSYEIVDEATFWEEFFLNQDDEIIREQLNDYTDTSSNLGIGIGVFIKNLVVVQVKYNISPDIGFVTKEGIVVVNDRIDYNPTKADMHTISLSIGFSLM